MILSHRVEVASFSLAVIFSGILIYHYGSFHIFNDDAGRLRGSMKTTLTGSRKLFFLSTANDDRHNPFIIPRNTTNPPALPHFTNKPTRKPTRRPTRKPNTKPTSYPISRPSGRPNIKPVAKATLKPSIKPKLRITAKPSTTPSYDPTSIPSARLTTKPSAIPAGNPTLKPSAKTTAPPSSTRTRYPTMNSSSHPSLNQISKPTWRPIANPTIKPASMPSSSPSKNPSKEIIARKTVKPSATPIRKPTKNPTTKASAASTTYRPTYRSFLRTAEPSSGKFSKISSPPSRQVLTFEPRLSPSHIICSTTSGNFGTTNLGQDNTLLISYTYELYLKATNSIDINSTIVEDTVASLEVAISNQLIASLFTSCSIDKRRRNLQSNVSGVLGLSSSPADIVTYGKSYLEILCREGCVAQY